MYRSLCLVIRVRDKGIFTMGQISWEAVNDSFLTF